MNVSKSLICWLTVVVALIPVAASAQVTGTLAMDDDQMTPTHAVAVRVDNPFEPDNPFVQVVLAEDPLDTDGAVEALSPDTFIADAVDGDSIIFNLSSTGELLGITISIGSRSFGLEGLGTALIETLDENRIVGRIQTDGPQPVHDSEIDYDISFSVEFLPDRGPGQTLPTGGGEPGAAYLAYLDAVRRGDATSLGSLCASSLVAALGDAGTAEMYLEMLRQDVPQEAAVAAGESFDHYAILDVAGLDTWGQGFEGHVKMTADGKAWRYAEHDFWPATESMEVASTQETAVEGETEQDPAVLWKMLLEAIQGFKADVAVACIVAGADVNTPDKDGLAPLNWAILYCQPPVVRALIDAGADVNYVRSGSLSVLQEAMACPDAVPMLKEAGAR